MPGRCVEPYGFDYKSRMVRRPGEVCSVLPPRTCSASHSFAGIRLLHRPHQRGTFKLGVPDTPCRVMIVQYASLGVAFVAMARSLAIPVSWITIIVGMLCQLPVRRSFSVRTLDGSWQTRKRAATRNELCMRLSKRKRRRVTEKNTGGTVGKTATRKMSVDLPQRIFVANIHYEAEESDLLPAFSVVGPVTGCKIIRDSFTGHSKGWGFVTYAEAVHATAALQSLQGYRILGRPVILDEAASLARKRKEAKIKAAFQRREEKRQAKQLAEMEAAKDAAARKPGGGRSA